MSRNRDDPGYWADQVRSYYRDHPALDPMAPKVIREVCTLSAEGHGATAIRTRLSRRGVDLTTLEIKAITRTEKEEAGHGSRN